MVKKIPLPKNKFTLIDDEDFEYLASFRWFCSGSYPYRKAGDLKVFMHRELLKCPPCYVVDHIDGDPFNNQKNNLRVVTQRENSQNRKHIKYTPRKHSPYKGVSKTSNGKWRAYIWIGGTYSQGGRQVHLGIFKTEELAASAYNDAAKALFKVTHLNEVV
jgi:hypothetical protein